VVLNSTIVGKFVELCHALTNLVTNSWNPGSNVAVLDNNLIHSRAR